MLLVLNSITMPRKTRANRVPSTPSVSPSRVQLFRNERSREAYEKLNSKRKIWAERSMILDEVDPAIRANLESRGWLSLLKIDHPPLTALIREFFSNLSCHIYDSNTVVQSWIQSVEFTITPRVVVRLHICFLELRVIPCGLFLISTPSPQSDVCFSMLSCLVRLSVFLTCSFVL